MKNKIKKFVVECDIYQHHKGESVVNLGLHQPFPILEEAWTDISMDFVEGLPSSHGKSIIFVIVDFLIKYAHFCATSHPYITVSVAHTFIKNIVKLHISQSIISNRDKIFTRNFWKELLCLQGT